MTSQYTHWRNQCQQSICRLSQIQLQIITCSMSHQIQCYVQHFCSMYTSLVFKSSEKANQTPWKSAVLIYHCCVKGLKSFEVFIVEGMVEILNLTEQLKSQKLNNQSEAKIHWGALLFSLVHLSSRWMLTSVSNMFLFATCFSYDGI